MVKIPDKPFVLVDGSSYLFRAYYALPPLVNSKGKPTGAIYGVVKMLQKLIATYSPDIMAVVFDCKEKTFRHKLFADYKANRVQMPEDLAEQIEPLHNIIRAMGLPLIAHPGVEADDVIGTLARIASKQKMFTLISTGDKDLAQLVDDQTVLINTMTDVILDPSGVLEKFKVAPQKIIDYLSLVGDTADNIPGVPKVGPKTAVKWLESYGSLDEIIKNSSAIKGKVGENLKAAIEQIPLYRKLATIKLDVKLDVAPKDLNIKLANDSLLQEIYREYEFKSFKSMESTQINNNKNNNINNNINNSSRHQVVCKIIYKKKELDQIINQIKQAKIFVIDFETTSLDYMQAKIVGVAIAVEPQKAFYIPVGHDYEGAPEQLPIKTVLEQIKLILENNEYTKIGHNLKYDYEVAENYGIKASGPSFDTMLAAYVLNSLGRHDMDTLALKYLDYTTISYEQVAGKGAKQISFNQVEVDLAGPYAAEDADITLRLHNLFWPQIKKDLELKKIFIEIEILLLPVLVNMERRGVLIDGGSLYQQSLELEKRLNEIKQQVFKASDQDFNLNSPKQLQEVLYDKLELPVLQKTPAGKPSTAEPVLQELALDFPLPKLILEYRSLSKLKSTYTDSLPNKINPETGRVHTSYHQAVTSTGRLSSTEPNLQNIPIRTKEGKKIRTAFVAPEGYKILSADYSQIELRIMAHLSADPGLLKTFANGEDVHKATASEVFAVDIDAVTDAQRRHAKAINFGLIYGMSAFGLSKQLGIERKEAAEYMQAYFAKFPRVQDFMQETKHLAAEQGFVKTMFGRRLYLPQINSKNPMQRAAAERAAINAPMQGAQADIIKLAMIQIDSWLQKKHADIYMVMQVHDELVFEVPVDKINLAVTEIKNIMQQAAVLDVELVVECGWGNNWEEAH